MADVEAVSRYRNRWREARRPDAAARAGREQGRGLPIDDLEIVGDRHRRVPAEATLEDLALGERDALGRPSDHLRLEARAQRERATEEEVAGDERVAQPEHGERGRIAAPHLAAVDDVVVEQRRRVDQLEGHGRFDDVVTTPERTVRARVRDKQHHHGTDALAAGADEMHRDLGEPRLARRELLGEPALDAGEVGDHVGRDVQRGGAGLRDGIHRSSGLNENAPTKSRIGDGLCLCGGCWLDDAHARGQPRAPARRTEGRAFPGLPARHRDARHGDRPARGRRRRRGRPPARHREGGNAGGTAGERRGDAQARAGRRARGRARRRPRRGPRPRSLRGQGRDRGRTSSPSSKRAASASRRSR